MNPETRFFVVDELEDFYLDRFKYKFMYVFQCACKFSLKHILLTN